MSVAERVREKEEEVQRKLEFFDPNNSPPVPEDLPIRQYERTLPEAIEKQRLLFLQLKQLGVISMLEEMTVVEIQSPSQPDEKSSEQKQPGERTPKKSWHARVNHPRSDKFGSAKGSPLQITLERYDYIPNMLFQISEVNVSFSQNKRLTIEGEDVFFNDIVNKENIAQKREEIEDALATAFTGPLMRGGMTRGA